MAYSIQNSISDGITDTFVLAFPYLERSHVTVEVDGASAPFTWLSDTVIQLDSMPAADLLIEIRRTTPDGYVQFTNSSILNDDLMQAFKLYNQYRREEQDDANPGRSYWQLRKGGSSQTFNSSSFEDVTWTATAEFRANVIPLGGVVTIPAGEGGVYLISVNLSPTTSIGDSVFQVRVYCEENGQEFRFRRSGAADGFPINYEVTALMQLQVGDTVRVQVRRESGAGSFVTSTDPDYNWFSGVRVA